MFGAWALALCLLSVGVAAQSPAQLALGQRSAGTTSTDGGEFHAFAAIAGTRLQLTLSLPATLGAVTLYDQAGDEIARAEGRDAIALAHTLEEDGIYLVGITSAASGIAYTLALDGQEPRIAYVYDEPEPGAATLPAVATSPPAPAQPGALETSTPPPVDPPAFAADPAVWGVYARLAGRRTASETSPYQMAWVWSRPGEELKEEWRDSQGKLGGTVVIVPTGQPGELRLRSGALGGKEWIGRVDEEGRITYVGSGLFKWAFIVDLPGGDVYRSRRTKVDAEGRPTSIQPATERNLWPLVPAGE